MPNLARPSSPASCGPRKSRIASRIRTRLRTSRFASLPRKPSRRLFGTGIGAELHWHDLEIAREANGRPYVILHGGGLALLAARGARQVHLSLSHTQQYATATAILEG